MDSYFDEIEVLWKVRIVAPTTVARSLMKDVKVRLDEAVKQMPNILVSESVIEAWKIKEEETK